MIRKCIEDREEMILSPYAAKAKKSKGRQYPEKEDSIRTCYMRDRDRIIHSKAFRRLKHKTQVYISPNSDHYRTRLTHTLEVSQIARTIGRSLRLNEDLLEAIALAHDVGHTPFAHAGEAVLNRLMTKGFKHNENSVRVLTKIERKSDKYLGLNLSEEVLDGVLHHSGFNVSKEKSATFEGQIIRLSDKIAYVQHDIDDAIRAGALKESDLPKKARKVLGNSHGERIDTLVKDLISHTQEKVDKGKLEEIELSQPVNEALVELREFMFKNVYLGDVCLGERERANIVVEYLYKFYIENPEKMPEFYYNIAKKEDLETGVSDYISGMTDNYCVNLFKTLTIPRSYIKML